MGPLVGLALAATVDRGPLCDPLRARPLPEDDPRARAARVALDDPSRRPWALPRAVRLGAPGTPEAVAAAWDGDPAGRGEVIRAWACLAPERAVGPLIALARTPPPAGGGPLTRQFAADPELWAGLAALGPDGRAAAPLLVDALRATRFEEEVGRVGVDQEAAAQVVAALAAVGVDDPALARALVAWAGDEHARARVAARWEAALVGPAREAVAADARATLTGAGDDAARSFAAAVAGRLADPAALDAALALALDDAAGPAARAEGWEAAGRIGAAHPEAWRTLPAATGAALGRAFAGRPDGAEDPRVGVAAALGASGEAAARAFTLRALQRADEERRARIGARWAEAMDPRDPAAVRVALDTMAAVSPRVLLEGPLGTRPADNALPADTARALLARAQAAPGEAWWPMLLHAYAAAAPPEVAAAVQAWAAEPARPEVALARWELQVALGADPLALSPAPAVPQGDRSVAAAWGARARAVGRHLEERGCDPAGLEALAEVVGLPAAAGVDPAPALVPYARVCPDAGPEGEALRRALPVAWGRVAPGVWAEAAAVAGLGAEAAEALAVARPCLSAEEADALTWLAAAGGGALPGRPACGPDGAPLPAEAAAAPDRGALLLGGLAVLAVAGAGIALLSRRSRA